MKPRNMFVALWCFFTEWHDGCHMWSRIFCNVNVWAHRFIQCFHSTHLFVNLSILFVVFSEWIFLFFMVLCKYRECVPEDKENKLTRSFFGNVIQVTIVFKGLNSYDDVCFILVVFVTRILIYACMIMKGTRLISLCLSCKCTTAHFPGLVQALL